MGAEVAADGFEFGQVRAVDAQHHRQLLQRPRQILPVLFRQFMQMLHDAADAGVAVIGQGLFARGRQADVDFAFVAGIDAAGD
jgi:hypothetical protein